jgi:hypothetical protein
MALSTLQHSAGESMGGGKRRERLVDCAAIGLGVDKPARHRILAYSGLEPIGTLI